VVTDLLNGALVEISAIALPNGARREVLIPDGWMKSPRPYSFIVRTDDLVFLSGLISRRAADDAFVPGSVGEQTRTVLENATALLKAAGVGLDQVVQSRVFITDEAVFAGMNDAYRKFFPQARPARATAVARLMGDDYLVEITLVATRGKKEVIGPASTGVPLSAVVRAGNRVFLSGVLGNTDANIGDIAAQTKEVMTRINRSLTQAGLSFADVADSTVYLTDLSQTPYGILLMLEHYKIETGGKHAVVIGRSNIVGRPISILLSRNTYPGNCTVTVCHSRTNNLKEICLQADIIVAALGIPEFLKADMVKENAVVVDVGITRVKDDSKKSGFALKGDVDFTNVAPRCSYITPVPGGVGLMTIAALLMNTFTACENKYK
jgi:5,10-methylene-tetrahydrofolate dehydrogenase/methenyl tetrahydrofolate cyclohydrolase